MGSLGCASLKMAARILWWLFAVRSVSLLSFFRQSASLILLLCDLPAPGNLLGARPFDFNVWPVLGLRILPRHPEYTKAQDPILARCIASRIDKRSTKGTQPKAPLAPSGTFRA